MSTFNLDEVKAAKVLGGKNGGELRKKALAAAIRNSGASDLVYDTIIDGRTEVNGASIPSGVEAVVGTSGELYVLKKGLAKLYDTEAFDEVGAIAEASRRGIAVTAKTHVDAAVKMLEEKNGGAQVEFLGWFSSKGHVQAFRFPSGTVEVKMEKANWGPATQENTGGDVIVFNLITSESYMIDHKAIKAEWYSVSNPALNGEDLMESIPALTIEDMQAMSK